MVIGIVGLGLMGASFALSVRSKLNKNDMIIGYDHNKKHIKDSLSLKIIDESVEYDKLLKISDVIIYAIPVEGILCLFQNITSKSIKKNATIIDLGSTKKSIINALKKDLRKNLVAAHPMAGTEYNGPRAAFSSLYEDKIVVLCDIDDSGDIQKQTAIKLFKMIGMKIIYMNAHKHDVHAAFISHMPHLISYSLANSVLLQEDKEHILILAAGGFKDMSRLAKSSPKMWKDIFKQNKSDVLHALNIFCNEAQEAKKFIKNDDWDSLLAWMQNANKLHEFF